MELIKRHDKVINTSLYALATDAYDLDNTPSGSVRANPNGTLGTHIPKGVIGGMCATPVADKEVGAADHKSPVIGLFSNQSEGNAFENAPGIASGIVPIFMGGGNFTLYAFETHAQEGGFASILSSYIVGAKLYCSQFGLLTTEKPSDHSDPGADDPVAILTKAPTSSDLSIGIKLLV